MMFTWPLSIIECISYGMGSISHTFPMDAVWSEIGSEVSPGRTISESRSRFRASSFSRWPFRNPMIYKDSRIRCKWDFFFVFWFGLALWNVAALPWYGCVRQTFTELAILLANGVQRGLCAFLVLCAAVAHDECWWWWGWTTVLV